MAQSKRMLIVTDGTGRVLAAAPSGDVESSKLHVGLDALPGQMVHEVDFPVELTLLESGHDFHLALSQARFDTAKAHLEFPRIMFKKIEH